MIYIYCHIVILLVTLYIFSILLYFACIYHTHYKVLLCVVLMKFHLKHVYIKKVMTFYKIISCLLVLQIIIISENMRYARLHPAVCRD